MIGLLTVVFLVCTCISNNVEAQDCPETLELQNGYNKYYNCVLQCYKKSFGFQNATGDLCGSKAHMKGAPQNMKYTMTDVAQSIKCITVDCKKVVPSSVCIASTTPSPDVSSQNTTPDAGNTDNGDVNSSTGGEDILNQGNTGDEDILNQGNTNDEDILNQGDEGDLKPDDEDILNPGNTDDAGGDATPISDGSLPGDDTVETPMNKVTDSSITDSSPDIPYESLDDSITPATASSITLGPYESQNESGSADATEDSGYPIAPQNELSDCDEDMSDSGLPNNEEDECVEDAPAVSESPSSLLKSVSTTGSDGRSAALPMSEETTTPDIGETPSEGSYSTSPDLVGENPSNNQEEDYCDENYDMNSNFASTSAVANSQNIDPEYIYYYYYYEDADSDDTHVENQQPLQPPEYNNFVNSASYSEAEQTYQGSANSEAMINSGKYNLPSTENTQNYQQSQMVEQNQPNYNNNANTVASQSLPRDQLTSQNPQPEMIKSPNKDQSLKNFMPIIKNLLSKLSQSPKTPDTQPLQQPTMQQPALQQQSIQQQAMQSPAIQQPAMQQQSIQQQAIQQQAMQQQAMQQPAMQQPAMQQPAMQQPAMQQQAMQQQVMQQQAMQQQAMQQQTMQQPVMQQPGIFPSEYNNFENSANSEATAYSESNYQSNEEYAQSFQNSESTNAEAIAYSNHQPVLDSVNQDKKQPSKDPKEINAEILQILKEYILKSKLKNP